MDIFIIIRDILISILIFGILFLVARFIYKKMDDSDHRALDPLEYFPEEEYQTLNQVFYLVMMLVFFVFIIYIIAVEESDFIGVTVLQFIISLYVTLVLDYSSWKNRILFFMLIPYEAIAILILQNAQIIIWPISVMHVLVYAYLMKICYDKFKEFTQSNSLGITIVLLFTLIFVSFIVTSVVEGVEPLNALVMVSNAFTSNGYAILGNTGVGKLTALILVWGGYVISGVGTATLTAAILLAHNKKRDEELNKRLDELESMIEKNKK